MMVAEIMWVVVPARPATATLKNGIGSFSAPAMRLAIRVSVLNAISLFDATRRHTHTHTLRQQRAHTTNNI